MELLICSECLSEVLESSNGISFSDEEIDLIQKNTGLGEVAGVKYSPANIGPGSDFWTVLASIIDVKDLIFLAPAVLSGVENWKKLVDKVKLMIARHEVVALDEEGAQMLAVDYMMNHFPCKYLNIIDSHIIKTQNFKGIIRSDSSLVKAPYRYYILTFQTDDLTTYVIGVRSTGEINLIKVFDYNPYGLTEHNRS